jgi:hypothetical protein
MLPRAAEAKAMNWLEQMDREVEQQARSMRFARTVKYTLIVLLIGFALGCLVESQTHATDRFLEWAG